MFGVCVLLCVSVVVVVVGVVVVVLRYGDLCSLVVVVFVRLV